MKKILLMLSLLFFTTAGFSEVSDTLVTGGYDKQAMSDAIKHARKETVWWRGTERNRYECK